MDGLDIMKGFLLDGMKAYANQSIKTETAFIVCKLILLISFVVLMTYLYLKRIDYEYQRLLMILRFFSEGVIRRNKTVMYLLHHYKLFSL